MEPPTPHGVAKEHTKEHTKENPPLPPAPTGDVRPEPGRDEDGDDQKKEDQPTSGDVRPEPGRDAKTSTSRRNDEPTSTARDRRRTETTRTAAALVDGLVNRVPALANTSGSDRTRLTAAIFDALERGLTLSAVSDTIVSRDLTGLDHPIAGIVARVRQLLPPPAPAATRPRHCRRCYEPTRMMVGDDDKPYKCPRCHPDMAKVAA
jgi:hypothetical protein